jgi:hypothetical protein
MRQKDLQRLQEFNQSRNKTLKVAVCCKAKDLRAKVKVQLLVWKLNNDWGK